MLIQCTCRQCGAALSAKPSRLAAGRGIFCSRSCTGKSRTGARNSRWKNGGGVLRVCERCSAPFRTWASEVRRGGGKYCSRSCYEAMQHVQVGALSPRWKGGRSLNPAGYMLEHRSNGNHIGEHRAIMERILGRRLGTDEHVHHVNHDRADNRPENLQVMPKTEHLRLHADKRRGQRKIEGWSIKHECCIECGKTDRPHGSKGLCRRCNLRRFYRERHGRTSTATAPSPSYFSISSDSVSPDI